MGSCGLSAISTTDGQGAATVVLATQRRHRRLALLLGSHLDDPDYTAYFLYNCHQFDPANLAMGGTQLLKVRLFGRKIQIANPNRHPHAHLFMVTTAPTES
jgi:hypothetical protein